MNDYSDMMENTSDSQYAMPWVAVDPTAVPGVWGWRGEERVRVWALVLDARGVPCLLEESVLSQLELLVPADLLETARHEISQYEMLNRNWPPPLPPPRPLVENTLTTLSVLLLLAIFHNLAQLDMVLPGGMTPDWFTIGSARAGLIVQGEWWRTVTALTLHRDAGHLLANLSIGGVFAWLLCRDLGSGLAWLLILCTGVLGNLANAMVQPPLHDSVGASTAVFGVIGLLAAINMVRYRQHLRHRWALPVAAAVALLAVLGAEGKTTDLGAHLFGFVSGILVGLVTGGATSRLRAPGGVLNLALGLCSGIIVVIAWIAAIAHGA